MNMTVVRWSRFTPDRTNGDAGLLAARVALPSHGVGTRRDIGFLDSSANLRRDRPLGEHRTRCGSQQAPQ